MDTKRCSKCGEIKPLNEFSKDRHKANGTTSSCKECRNKVRRQPIDPVPKGFQRCTACHLILPATREYFSPQKERPDGFVSNCKECRRKRGQLWRQQHPEQAKQLVQQYYKNNTGKHREKSNRRNTKKRQLIADFTDADWQYALDYWHGACAYCGHGPSLFDRNYVLHQEHHIPLKRGGGYTVTNIVPACQSCNFNKSGKDPEQWMVERFGKKKSKAILARIHDYFSHYAHRINQSTTTGR